MKKFTRERVVPIISASVSCDSRGTVLTVVVLFAIPREQQQGAGEPSFAGVEELVDEIFFNPDVAREHVSNESV